MPDGTHDGKIYGAASRNDDGGGAFFMTKMAKDKST